MHQPSRSSAVSLFPTREDEYSPHIPSTAISLGLTSPPAYHHGQSPIETDMTAPPSNADGNDLCRCLRPDLDKQTLSECAPDDTDHNIPLDDHIPYSPSLEMAHVATDDKRLLAKMSAMASAPPMPTDNGQPSVCEVSAPVWRDEELHQFPETPGDCITSPPLSCSPFSHVPPPMFPALLLEEEMASELRYDFPSFEELGDGMEPSAPPFEAEVPSAPSMEDIAIKASAPPLADV